MTGFFADDRFWDVTSAEQAELNSAAGRLTDVGIESALKEARLLWAAVARENDAKQSGQTSPNSNADFLTLIERRIAHEPLSHLVGYRDFYDLRFDISAGALDPRPETELLVTEALKFPFESVLDLGTGSGCILLSLLHANSAAYGLGVDQSDDALTVAKRNAEKHGLTDRSELQKSDWFSAVKGRFDLIVSNPPYITLDEMAGLQPEVRNYEPRLALTDEANGLTCYQKIIEGHDPFLRDEGRLIVEGDIPEMKF